MSSDLNKKAADSAGKGDSSNQYLEQLLALFNLITFVLVLLDIAQARYENPLSVEIGITSREEFILIERKLARLWDRLIQENVRETPEESGEVVQDSMEEDDVVNNDSSEEVVSTVNKAPKITFDLNKIPEENCFV
ncbi:hypothetical protein Ahy_B05g077255 isoform B [Arachis hypogaea]|uniref:Uncharacterized protein n=1 Tax=Arachis hypogaea TaxID=3818 RepID=A0A444Z4Q5_ARAHY|nr:hypothetical protein Ahy_B05g077255 isoform B [Arachis hypogaea]